MLSVSFCCVTGSVCKASLECKGEKQYRRLSNKKNWIFGGAIFDAALVLSFVALAAFACMNLGPKFLTELPFSAKVIMITGTLSLFVLDIAYVSSRFSQFKRLFAREIKENASLQGRPLTDASEKLHITKESQELSIDFLDKLKIKLDQYIEMYQQQRKNIYDLVKSYPKMFIDLGPHVPPTLDKEREAVELRLNVELIIQELEKQRSKVDHSQEELTRLEMLFWEKIEKWNASEL